jgi:hypothetical protein
MSSHKLTSVLHLHSSYELLLKMMQATSMIFPEAVYNQIFTNKDFYPECS